ncbi:MAG: MerR family transcriptional regulator [Deltaproteobacteria bacterium]|nr:MerR family transcriptional regulator [Deltaproteobacteria bacterium]
MVYAHETELRGSKLLTSSEVSDFESRYPGGMTSAEIVNVFSTRGIRFSEATLRKYVQQGLLPRSQRVGQKGKHKGSRGIYPVSTIRQINEIKRLMAMDYTIEEIQSQFAFVDGEMEELKQLLDTIVKKLEQSSDAAAEGGLVTSTVTRQLEEANTTAKTLVDQLESAVRQIRERAHIARDAV